MRYTHVQKSNLISRCLLWSTALDVRSNRQHATFTIARKKIQWPSSNPKRIDPSTEYGGTFCAEDGRFPIAVTVQMDVKLAAMLGTFDRAHAYNLRAHMSEKREGKGGREKRCIELHRHIYIGESRRTTTRRSHTHNVIPQRAQLQPSQTFE